MSYLGLQGKIILVTGVDGILGSAIRRGLLSEGAEVLGVDIKETSLTSKLDISDIDEVDMFVKDLKDKGIMLDGLVNNAVMSFKGANITSDKFDITTKVNIKGVYNCMIKFVSVMNPYSSIVNMSSLYGMLSPQYDIYDNNEEIFSSGAYGASKAAVLQLTRYYATYFAGLRGKTSESWGRSIRVNSISPGGIWHNHNEEFMEKYGSKVPMGRMAQVDEIVQPIMFLLSPKSSYITGHNLVVDGGMSAW